MKGILKGILSFLALCGLLVGSILVANSAKAAAVKKYPYTIEGPGGTVYVYCDTHGDRVLYLYPTPYGAGIVLDQNKSCQ